MTGPNLALGNASGSAGKDGGEESPSRTRHAVAAKELDCGQVWAPCCKLLQPRIRHVPAAADVKHGQVWAPFGNLLQPRVRHVAAAGEVERVQVWAPGGKLLQPRIPLRGEWV